MKVAAVSAHRNEAFVVGTCRQTLDKEPCAGGMVLWMSGRLPSLSLGCDQLADCGGEGNGIFALHVFYCLEGC